MSCSLKLTVSELYTLRENFFNESNFFLKLSGRSIERDYVSQLVSQKTVIN